MTTDIQLNEKVQALSALLGRAQLAIKLGSQYDGNRDIYQALGYPTDLTYEKYAAQYLRQDIAKAIINRPIQATWNGEIQVLQADDENETKFEKVWKDLWDKQQLKPRFIRLDKLASLGQYGVLLLGLDDTHEISDWKKPVTGKRQLLYTKPLSEGSAKIGTFDNNTSSERFGQPETYQLTVKSGNNSGSQQLDVHYSRVIHVPGELLESEVYGVPVLQAVFNRLMDLEKLVGASAEMFWRGARPGFKGTVDKDFTLTDPMKADLQDQLNEYEHNLRRFLINEGIDIDALEMQVAEPRWHVDVQLQMISAVTGIPKRILVGSERGELASSEDRGIWLELIQARRKDYVEPQIMHPFITRCIKYGILPKPSSDYKVYWPDLFSPSEKERADIGKTRASAVQSYMNNPAAELIVPPEVFYEYMLGLDEDDVEHVKKVHKKFLEESANEELNQIRESLLNQPAGGGGRPPAPGPIVPEEGAE